MTTLAEKGDERDWRKFVNQPDGESGDNPDRKKEIRTGEGRVPKFFFPRNREKGNILQAEKFCSKRPPTNQQSKTKDFKSSSSSSLSSSSLSSSLSFQKKRDDTRGCKERHLKTIQSAACWETNSIHLGC